MMDEMLNRIEGTWEIVATNFPMWTSGKNHQPQISYARCVKNDRCLIDTVQFVKNDKTKKIIGTDRYENETFVWRGKGLLKLLKSEWSVLYLSDDILMIKFKKSIITPAGIDVLVKNKADLNSREAIADVLLGAKKIEKRMLDELVWLN